VRVIHHERKSGPDHFSIERLFAEVRRHMPSPWEVEVGVCPRPSRGVSPRIVNILQARRLKGDVHHIVGDVHYLAFGLPRRRTVLTIHDCAALGRLGGVRRAVLKYFWFTGPVRRVAITTTISESTRQELRRWIGRLADGIEVVPDCVCDVFRPSPKEFNAAAPVALQVGTKWNKNLERVVRALRGSPCRLEIIGALSAGQRKLLAECGVAHVELGRVGDDELLAAYRRCDFLIFPSLYEGFGLPILEAQATGRPVITSGQGATKEAAGEGALFVDPCSEDSIRSAVVRLREHPELRARLLGAGFANVERFRAAAIARRYAEIYGRVDGLRA
jgi:glycosyltransferase involved in cell wall biosynthesis